MTENAADQIAKATIDETDLVRGVVGSVQVEGLEKVHEVQRAFFEAGWVRDRSEEGYSKLEHQCLKNKAGDRVAQITVGNFMGIFAEIEVKARTHKPTGRDISGRRRR